MKKYMLVAMASAAIATATATESPLWLRNVAISPDGRTIAFTFKGDVYTVPVGGGEARQITSNPAYDSNPVWSPDGSKIAFSSNREGSDDIYVTSMRGGTARRLTTHSGSEVPRAWINDSTIAFVANIAPSATAIQGPFSSQVYTVTTDASRPKMLSTIPMQMLSASASGAILYQDRKGYENVWRKHEHSSSTGDIWLLDKDKNYKCLTTFNGNDQNPVWTGSDSFVYLSEEDGTLNVYSRNISGSERRQLTGFERHPVRSLSASANGDILAFSWNGEIYTLVPGQQPTKVEVSITSDDYDGDFQSSVRTSGATAMDVSPDGKELAFVLRGDVYVTSVEYSTTKRITNTSGQERCVSYSADGRSLVYDSERDGLWSIYISKIKDDKEKSFAYCTDVVEELLYSSDQASQQPVFSPDGKKVAFLENRTTLRVIDVATKKVTTVLDGKYNYSYSDGDVQFMWSPDSRQLLASYIGVGGWNNIDIAMVAADGSTVVDLTESGYSDENPRWALGGEAITWATSRYGMRSHGSWGSQDDIMVMALTAEAWDKLHLTKEEAALAKENSEENSEEDSAKDAKKDKKDKKKDKAKEDEKPAIAYDLDNRALRVQRLTPMSALMDDYFLAPDGDKLYYVAVDPSGDANLMAYDLREGEGSTLVKDVYGSIVPDAKGENIFMLSGKGIVKVTLSDGSKDMVAFEAPYDRHPSLEREYIFDHMLSQVEAKFYDVNLHGVDWRGYGQDYRKFLPYINCNEDFAILMSEILGELNASHTGAKYRVAAKQPTASLATFFDQDYVGDGLRVAEVVAGGPLSTAQAGVVAGDIIEAIDGTAITSDMDYYPLLADKAGKRVRLTIRSAADGSSRSVVVKPISYAAQKDLLYHRWVRRNQAFVDSISGGRIGYVHVEGMDSPSFRTVYSELLGKYRNCDAVVVDTRWNGGGWLHNDIAILFGGKEYLKWMPRGQYVGSEPYSQWLKPSVMLVNEANYSDAHGTPFVYQTLGIGDIVGAPVPGTMTAVWWENQIDPNIVFGIPQVTSVDSNGNVLENHQLTPDVEVYNTPEHVAAGIDDQIIKAVDVLLQKLDK